MQHWADVLRTERNHHWKRRCKCLERHGSRWDSRRHSLEEQTALAETVDGIRWDNIYQRVSVFNVRFLSLKNAGFYHKFM